MYTLPTFKGGLVPSPFNQITIIFFFSNISSKNIYFLYSYICRRVNIIFFFNLYFNQVSGGKKVLHQKNDEIFLTIFSKQKCRFHCIYKKNSNFKCPIRKIVNFFSSQSKFYYISNRKKSDFVILMKINFYILGYIQTGLKCWNQAAQKLGKHLNKYHHIMCVHQRVLSVAQNVYLSLYSFI